jgi:hypothetical protein
MNATDFAKTWHDLAIERSKLSDERNNLETELLEIRHKIAHIDEVLSHLAPLAGLPYTDADENISQLGITDAIRWTLKTADERLSARDIRTRLAEKGYDLSGLSAPMASIYKILGRLTDDSKEVEREKEDGRVFYRWKDVSAEITEEDIPF